MFGRLEAVLRYVCVEEGDPTTATSTEGGSGQRRWTYQTYIWILLQSALNIHAKYILVVVFKCYFSAGRRIQLADILSSFLSISG